MYQQHSSYSLSITSEIYNAIRNYDDKVIITCNIDKSRRYFEIIELELSLMRNQVYDKPHEPFGSIMINTNYWSHWGNANAEVEIYAKTIPLEPVNFNIDDFVERCLKQHKHLDPIFTMTHSITAKEIHHNRLGDFDDGIPEDKPKLLFPKKLSSEVKFKIFQRRFEEQASSFISPQVRLLEIYQKIGQSTIPYVAALKDIVQQLRSIDESMKKPPIAGSI